MASIGNLFASLTLNSAEFIAGLKKAEKQTTTSAGVMSKSMDGLRNQVRGVIAVLSVDFVAGLVKGALDYADAIADLSDRTGFATKTIQEFRYAAQLSGSDIETADVALEKFTKNLGLAQGGSKAQVAMFAELGVTAKDVDVAFRQAIDGISKLDTVQKRNAASMELFGKKAGTLTSLLGKGSQGFEELAKKAHELGVVLADDVVRNAGEANDKLDTMKMILTAQLASAIVQNAGALVQLADGIGKVTAGLINFWAQNPKTAMAILGAIAGFTLGGGVGAALGAGAGFLGGAYLEDKTRKANPALYKAQQEQAAARANLEDARKGKTVYSDPTGLGLITIRNQGKKPDTKAAQARVSRADAEVARLQAAAAAKVTGPPVVPVTGNLPTPVGKTPKAAKPTGPTAAEIAKMMADNLFAFNRDLSDAQGDLRDSQSALLGNNPVEQARLERETLKTEIAQRNAAIDKDAQADPTKPGEPAALTQAQADQLKSINEQILQNRVALIDQVESQRLLEEQNKIRASGLSNEQDILTGALAMAKTAKERRSIELRILDLQFQQEKIALEAITASKTATDAEKQIAQARLNILDKLKNQQSDQIKQGTMGPLESYLDSIPKTAEEIDEAFQTIAVGGLQEFKEGLLDAIMESKNLGEVFGNVAKSIIRGLLDIALQQAIIKPIGDALFGGSSGGGGGGFLGSIIGGAKKLLGGALGAPTLPTDTTGFNLDDALSGGRANGGLAQPGLFTINERGDEVVNLPNGGSVVPASIVKMLYDKTDQSTTIVNVSDRSSAQNAISKAGSDDMVMNVDKPRPLDRFQPPVPFVNALTPDIVSAGKRDGFKRRPMMSYLANDNDPADVPRPVVSSRPVAPAQMSLRPMISGLGKRLSAKGQTEDRKSSIDSIFTGARANGGLSQPGFYKVNERGDEAVNLPNGGTVIPSNTFKNLVRSGGNGGTVINVDARGSTDPAQTRLQVAQGIAAAMPINNQNASNYTVSKLQRPKIMGR